MSTYTWPSDVLSRVERNGSSAAQHDHKRSCLVSGYVSDAAVYEVVVTVTQRGRF